MKKVKAFFSVFVNSILPHEPYYSRLLHLRFSGSLKYFFSVLAFVYMLLIIRGIAYVHPSIISIYRECMSKTITKFPEDYRVYLSHGVLSTNADKPFFIWLSCDNNHPFLFAVIDERGQIENFHSYQTKILVTGNDIAYGNGEFFLRRHLNVFLSPLTKFTKHDLSRFNVLFFNTVDRFIPYVVITFFILVPIVLIFSSFILVGLVSLFTMMFYRVFNKKYHFKKVVQLGFHASTLPLLLCTVSVYFYSPIPITILLTLFLFVIFHLVAVYEAHYGH